MEKINIQSIIDLLTIVNPSNNYWFMRTLGGEYYNEFVENNFIAIGYDEIKLTDIYKAKIGNEYNENLLAEIILNIYPDELRPRYIGTQLIDFTYNIKKGDIVIIPSYSSTNISIGIILETPVYTGVKNSNYEHYCPFEKRKKVKWLKKNLSFDSLDSKLLYLKYSHRTVTIVNDETSQIIDRLIMPLFIKSNDAHLSINIGQTEPINAFELFNSWIELFEVVEEFAKDENIDFNKNEFDVKINIQSPGTIEFISYSIIGVVILSILVAGLVGADIEADSKILKFKIKTDGIIGKISDFLNNKKDRQFKEQLMKKVKKMNINPDELVKILEQIKD